MYYVGLNVRQRERERDYWCQYILEKYIMI